MKFYYFSHFLQAWILPPGLNLISVIFGFVISRYSKYIGKGIIIISFISLWLFCTPIIVQLFINQLQYQYPMLQTNKITKNNSSAIIVLGGGHDISPISKSGYILSNATESRLHYAAYLYHQTHIPIIVSGGTLNKSEPTEAKLMSKEMKYYFKVPVAWEEDKSINTKDEGNYMVSILQKNNIATVYLITNAWHMPRSIYTFKHSFRNTKIKIIAAPMGYIISQPNQGSINYLPSLKGLETSVTAMHEYIGILAYHLSNLI